MILHPCVVWNGLAGAWWLCASLQSFKLNVDSHCALKEAVEEEGHQLLELIASHKAGKSSWNTAGLYVSRLLRRMKKHCCKLLHIFTSLCIINIYIIRLTFKIYKCFIYCIQCCDTYKMKYCLQRSVHFIWALPFAWVPIEITFLKTSHWHAFWCRSSGNNIKIMNESCSYRHKAYALGCT